MSGALTRVFIARLAGIAVFDPRGDQVGKVRDVVVTLRHGNNAPRVLGLVVEVQPRRRIFCPMTRVTNIDSGAVVTTGLLNMRRFEQRAGETLVLAELLDKRVTLLESGEQVTVQDVGIQQERTRDWSVSRIFVRKTGSGFRRRGETLVVEWSAVSGLSLADPVQGVESLLATVEKLRPGGPRQRPAGAHRQAAHRARRRARRREARRRPRGAARGRPRRDRGRARGRARRRRPRGDGPRRRRRPAVRAPGGDAGGAARARRARRRRGPAPPAQLRRLHRRRHDDAGAGDPPAGLHRGRGAGAGPRLGPLPGARGPGLRRARAVRDADRQVPRRRALPAAAARAAVDPGLRRARRLPRAHRSRRRR